MTPEQESSRMNIHFGKELMAEIGEFRGILNVSNICQEAVKARIRTIKRMRGGVEEHMDAIVERLDKEEEEAGSEDYEFGERDGYKHAQGMSLRDIRLSLRMSDSYNNEVGIKVAPFEWLPEFMRDWIEDNESGDYGDIVDWDSYVLGWFAGVESFWNDVEKKREERAAAAKAKAAKKLKK